MSTTALVIVVIVAVIVILAAAVAWSVTRRNSLRRRFGDEYEDVLDTAGSRRLAEAELRQRQRRHLALNLTPLSAESQQAYAAQWQEIQERFVDDPTGSLADADTLVTTVIAEIGYPTDDFDQQASYLSVEHGATVSNYRVAHDLNGDGTVSTEELRQALVHYRSVLTSLLGTEPTAHPAGGTPVEPVADDADADLDAPAATA